MRSQQLERFGRSSHRKNGRHKKFECLPQYLSTKSLRSEAPHLEDKPLTAVAVKNTLLGVEQKEKPTMIMEVFAKHNAQMKELIGKEYAYGTWEWFTTSSIPYPFCNHSMAWKILM